METRSFVGVYPYTKHYNELEAGNFYPDSRFWRSTEGSLSFRTKRSRELFEMDTNDLDVLQPPQFCHINICKRDGTACWIERVANLTYVESSG